MKLMEGVVQTCVFTNITFVVVFAMYGKCVGWPWTQIYQSRSPIIDNSIESLLAKGQRYRSSNLRARHPSQLDIIRQCIQIELFLLRWTDSISKGNSILLFIILVVQKCGFGDCMIVGARIIHFLCLTTSSVIIKDDWRWNWLQ